MIYCDKKLLVYIISIQTISIQTISIQTVTEFMSQQGSDLE